MRSKGILFLAVLLFLGLAVVPAAQAQTITYTTTGKLVVVNGPDGLGLGNSDITVTSSLQVNQLPNPGTTNQYATKISVTDSALPIAITGQAATITINYNSVNSPSNNITLSSSVTFFGQTINILTTIAVPGLFTVAPASLPTTPLTSADTLVLTSGTSGTTYTFVSDANVTAQIASSPSVSVCSSVSLSQTALSFTGAGGSQTVTATASPAPCSVTTSSSDSSWLTVTPVVGLGSGLSGTGGPFVITATPNLVGTRTATVTIGGQTVTVTEGVTSSCVYTVSPLTLNFGGPGGTATVSVTTSDPSCTWTASTSTSWLSVTPTSGTGNGTVTVTAQANTTNVTRTGSLSVAGIPIPVTQTSTTACAYTVSPLSLSYTSAGGSLSVSVTTSDPSCTWTVTSNVPWITATGGGTGSGTATLTASTNATGSSRSGTVTVAGQTVTVTQSSSVGCSFSISPTTLSFLSTGGVQTLSLVATSSTCAWTASAPGWLGPTGLSAFSGTGSATITVTAPAQLPGALSRSGTITVAGLPVTVSEAAPPGCTFTISPTAFNFDSNAANAVLTVTPSAPTCTWTVMTNAAWATPTVTSGTGTQTVTTAIQANTTGIDRTATLTVAGQSVSILQDFTATVFTDVLPGSYYFDAVNLLSTKNITTGCAPGLYCPTENITRAEAAIFIVRSVYGSDNFTYSPTPYFLDVQPTDFGFQWVQKLFELGITSGCGNGDFCPNDSISRDDMSIFIIRARLGATTVFTFNPVPYFTDVPTTYFAFPWIQRLKDDQITDGCQPTLFCPVNPVLRGDMAIFVMRGEYNQLLTPGTPVISNVSPNVLTQGSTTTVTVTGLNTNFVQGTTVVTAVPGVTIGAVTVSSPTLLTVSLTVAADALQQPEPMLVITGTQQAVLPNGLIIQ